MDTNSSQGLSLAGNASEGADNTNMSYRGRSYNMLAKLTPTLRARVGDAV